MHSTIDPYCWIPIPHPVRNAANHKKAVKLYKSKPHSFLTVKPSTVDSLKYIQWSALNKDLDMFALDNVEIYKLLLFHDKRSSSNDDLFVSESRVIVILPVIKSPHFSYLFDNDAQNSVVLDVQHQFSLANP